MAVTLSFEDGCVRGTHAVYYSQALQQILQGIQHCGFLLSSSQLMAPAASYVATRDFCQEIFSLAPSWKGQAIHIQPWIQLDAHGSHNIQAVFLMTWLISIVLFKF
jgi:hypothetical protein